MHHFPSCRGATSVFLVIQQPTQVTLSVFGRSVYTSLQICAHNSQTTLEQVSIFLVSASTDVFILQLLSYKMVYWSDRDELIH